jgi:hypothetical protein
MDEYEGIEQQQAARQQQKIEEIKKAMLHCKPGEGTEDAFSSKWQMNIQEKNSSLDKEKEELLIKVLTCGSSQT